MGEARSKQPEWRRRYEQERRRRKHEVRPRTIGLRCITQRLLDDGRRQGLSRDHWRPTLRAECVLGARPCPYVGCVYHLYLDLTPLAGSIKLNFPDLEPWQMMESCALDVADRGGSTLEAVGALMNVTRERIRQLEAKALAKLKRNPAAAVLRAMAVESGGAG